MATFQIQSNINITIQNIRSNNILIKLLNMQSIQDFRLKIRKLTHAHNQKPMNETRNLIRKVSRDNADVSVLEAIANYSNKQPISQLLISQQYPENKQQMNKFAQMLTDAAQPTDNHKSHNQQISFMEYKISPQKTKQSYERKKKKHKTGKFPLTVEMPEQLKMLKNKLISLPVIKNKSQQSNQLQNEMTAPLNCEEDQDSTIQLLKTGEYEANYQNHHHPHEKRIKTEPRIHNSIDSSRKSTTNQFSTNLSFIMEQLQSSKIKESNRYCLIRHNQCVRLNQRKTEIRQKYEMFEKLGQPPHKIIKLLNEADRLQRSVNDALDRQLKHQISDKNSKRYDVLIRNQIQQRKFKLNKFRERERNQKVDECKNSMIESKNNSFNANPIKINSKGESIKKVTYK